MTVVFCWMPSPLPVTVTGYVPVAVLAPTVIVIVDVPEPGAGIGFGLKLTVVPEGAPAADKVIALLKPPLTLVVILDVPWLPCWMLSDAGDAEMAKLGCCEDNTVNVSVVLCWMPPPLPVTVIG